MNDQPISACQYARDRHKNLMRWRTLWTVLLFIFGSTVVLFLCTSIVLFITASWLPGAITTLGTIVNGAGIAWAVNRRAEAVKEEEGSYKDVEEKCKLNGADSLKFAKDVQDMRSLHWGLTHRQD
jgi:hypothetical protein